MKKKTHQANKNKYSAVTHKAKPDGRELGGAQVAATPGAMVRQQIAQKGYDDPAFITSPDGSWTTINDGLAQQAHTQVTRSGKYAKPTGHNYKQGLGALDSFATGITEPWGNLFGGTTKKAGLKGKPVRGEGGKAIRINYR